MSKNTRRIQAYPNRTITAPDEVWDKFKQHKETYGGNWTQFIKYLNELIKKDNGTQKLHK